jgi:glutamate-ammonia-ligase adenylyltransferase
MDLERALAFSHYAARALAAEPSLRGVLEATLDSPFAWSQALPAIRATVDARDGAALAASLRRLRRRVFMHTMLRDLTGRAPLGEIVAAMTALAETAIRSAVELHSAALSDVHGVPRGRDSGAPLALIVVAMGKLGGGELNVSSDVDLVFVYPEDGETAGPRVIDNREYFERVGRKVVAALHEVTADGYVFRVDMRLRPYGDSGPLAISFPALEHYFVAQGRTWERYAWLKARALTGERDGELDAMITPFVYRKYLDYDAYAGLRDVHRQIRAQEGRRGYASDIKLGSGGIREIEFTTQALQLVRGGREPALRIRSTLTSLATLAERGILPRSAAESLSEAYTFLRTLEHRLQYRDDRQTQTLPDSEEERALLAQTMSLADEGDLERSLTRHRAAVELQFGAVLGPVEGEQESAPSWYRDLWEEPAPVDPLLSELRGAGFAEPETLIDTLRRARQGTRYAQLPALSKQRFDALVPELLRVAAEYRGAGADAQTLFARLFTLLEAVSRRSAYLALVIEHPPLLPRLAELMAASAWAADYVTLNPILLDELLDLRILEEEPNAAEWRAELARRLEQHASDPERQMDVLRHFQRAQTIRLLMQDLNGRLTVERLADHLSALADAILDATIACCWAQMPDTNDLVPRFSIVAYGKLGGKELGYASDLDLVFIYDDAREGAPERYARLAQRINNWLTSITAAGRLYDTDLRLRPDGAKGLTVSSLRAFHEYQREHAWTWEHQALTRARFAAGDAATGAAFEAEREAVLRLPRDLTRLATDVVDMRRRIAAGHANPTSRFDVKHDAGGMVDIEFAVQYLVLAHASARPELTANIGNIALLLLAGELGLVTTDAATGGADAYRAYRRAQHRMRLTGAPHARVEPEPYATNRAAVDRLWREIFGTPWSEPAAARPPRAGHKATSARMPRSMKRGEGN